MQANMFRLSAIGLALLALDAGAAGFGEISLQSRVGEPLRAEVPIIGDDAATIGTACFTLAPLRDSDIPVITAARTRLVRVGEGYRLIITGSRPVADPVFVIALRANCGAELQRDFVLMPQPPISLAESMPTQTSWAERAPLAGSTGRQWRASEGDSLESIAEALAPEDASKQRRLLAALKRANPQVDADTPLAEGSRIRVPDLRKKSVAEGEPRPRRTVPAPVARSAPPTPPPLAKAPPPTQAAAGDRLVLGAPPAELKPGEQATPLRASMPEVEQRILKLESTLHNLNEQVDKLSEALTLASETLVIQQKLQMAQALQSGPQVPAPVAQPLPPPAPPQSGNWLELLLSALLGGGLVSLVAHVMGKRRQQARESELTATTTAAAAPASPPPPHNPAPISATLPKPESLDPWKTYPASTSTSAPTATFTPVRASSVEEVDLLLDDQPTSAAIHVQDAIPAPAATPPDDGESALDLAEIMLSFGRVRGAADTLANYIEERAPDRIEPWLMLLNLYRRGGMRPEFEGLMERIRQRFNFRVPDWEHSQTPISGLKSLEDYAHIAQRLAKNWGTQSCLNYLMDLVQDTRQGQRAGFPLEVVEEIAMLIRILEDGYGCHRPDPEGTLKAA